MPEPADAMNDAQEVVAPDHMILLHNDGPICVRFFAIIPYGCKSWLLIGDWRPVRRSARPVRPLRPDPFDPFNPFDQSPRSNQSARSMRLVRPVPPVLARSTCCCAACRLSRSQLCETRSILQRRFPSQEPLQKACPSAKEQRPTEQLS